MTLQEKARAVVHRLEPLMGIGEARATVRIILEHIYGWKPVDIAIRLDNEISDFRSRQIDDIVDRLALGEPLQYILGSARFYGLDFSVTPDVLIPRPETEEMVDAILRVNTASDLRVLDIGTGSGCVAVALARNLRFPVITAIDVSEKALKVAAANAAALRTNIRFEHADMRTYNPPADSFDIIVSNPPYVAESERDLMEARVVAHEPGLALFVPDSDPLLFYRPIAALAARALVPGGRLYLEINPRFAADVGRLVADAGLCDVEIIRDIHGRNRFVCAQHPARS